MKEPELNGKFSLVSNEERISIIKEDTLMHVRHPRVMEGMLNVIQKVVGQIIFVRLIEPVLKSTVFIGDRITCQIIKQVDEYLIFGTIMSIDLDFPEIMMIHTENVYKYKNEREDKRYLVNFGANLFEAGGIKPAYSIVKNISKKGFAAVSNVCLEDTSNISVELPIAMGTKQEQVLEFKANIIRTAKTDSYLEYGMKIADISPHNRQFLEELLCKLDSDEREALNLMFKKHFGPHK